MERKTNVRIVGRIMAVNLGFLKWKYPKVTVIITSGFGGLITLLFASYLGFYPLTGDKKNK